MGGICTHPPGKHSIVKSYVIRSGKSRTQVAPAADPLTATQQNSKSNVVTPSDIEAVLKRIETTAAKIRGVIKQSRRVLCPIFLLHKLKLLDYDESHCVKLLMML